METEKGGVSCAPLLPVNLGSFPRIARCHDQRAFPEQHDCPLKTNPSFSLQLTFFLFGQRCCRRRPLVLLVFANAVGYRVSDLSSGKTRGSLHLARVAVRDAVGAAHGTEDLAAAGAIQPLRGASAHADDENLLFSAALRDAEKTLVDVGGAVGPTDGAKYLRAVENAG
jgi:hypothetical protein